MSELVKAKNEGYAQYEELLLRRDRLRKEAHILQGRYMKEFGDLITSIFEKKINCIQKKKTIAYCQTAINRGNAIDADEMQRFIDAEMKSYREQLKAMILENAAAHQMERIPIEEAAKVKRLYRELAKKLHPDINPKTGEDPELMDLWNKIVLAYNANDLEALEEAGIFAEKLLEADGGQSFEIPNLQEKIEKIQKQIENIKATDPYRYKFLLEDEELVAQRKAELSEELKEYEGYEQELEAILNQILANGGVIKWQMN